MPELPEVETVVRDLRPRLIDRRVVKITNASQVQLRHAWQTGWNSKLIHSRFLRIERRGKWILCELSDGALLIHLGMTGQLTIHDPDAPIANHTHQIFDLDDSHQLRYCDIRRFGSITYYSNWAQMVFVVDSKLGPEPFDMKHAHFHESISSSQRTIKSLLLDQSIIAGVGNIYADESRFHARIHPETTGNRIGPTDSRRLLKAIVKVLEHAIESRGSTIRNYVGGSGLKGGYQDEFAVYGRKNQPCVRCATTLSCIRVGGRSTHFCSQCQPVLPGESS